MRGKRIVFAGEQPASTITDQVRRGELVRLASGVYTTETHRDPADVVRQQMFTIVGRMLPNAVVTDRSARTGGAVEDVLYLAREGRARDARLPGLTVRARTGAGPQPSDTRLPDGLYLASKPRALAENCLPSRARSGQRRTFDDTELGDWVDFLCQTQGEERLAQWRREAEQMAPSLGVGDERLHRMQAAIGIALGTRPGEATSSRALSSRRSGNPVDQVRVARFETLASALRASAPQSRPEPPIPGTPGRTEHLPFFEAYFSNFIEGTEFEVDEAADIVYNHVLPENRSQDAHDIIGTYRLVADPDEMARTGHDGDEFVALVKRRNAAIMDGRPGRNPGVFKTRANRAGDTYFVEPVLVEGTLRAGYRLRDDLDTAWERAVYTAFVVAEVHPFDDGNGRTARVMMNAELTAGQQARIIIPTVFRQDYLDGLRLLSRTNDPSVFIKVMRYAHDFTASIDFSDYDEAKRLLESAHAFNEPDSADRLLVLAQGRKRSAT